MSLPLNSYMVDMVMRRKDISNLDPRGSVLAAFLILNGPAVQKISSSQIAVVRLQLLPCSPLAGSAATEISSTQTAVAILQAFLLGLPPKNPKKSDCSYHPAALLLGLPPTKNPSISCYCGLLKFLMGLQSKKSRAVKLQLLFAGPAASKI